MELKKPVYTTPEHHYCDFLKDFYFYAVPLDVEDVVVGYLTVCGFNKPVKIELAIIAELAAYKIINELIKNGISYDLSYGKELKLNRKQLEILKLLATGLPDKTIALEKGITINTVKYHKKNIFKKLGVVCSIQAVVKCLKLNLLSVGDIDC